MEKNSDGYEALYNFLKDYGVPDSMIYDGAQEQVGTGTKSQAKLRKYGIHGHTSERVSSNQNPAEGVIRELHKNGTEKCLEHTVQDNYIATDTHTFPISCN